MGLYIYQRAGTVSLFYHLPSIRGNLDRVTNQVSFVLQLPLSTAMRLQLLWQLQEEELAKASPGSRTATAIASSVCSKDWICVDSGAFWRCAIHRMGCMLYKGRIRAEKGVSTGALYWSLRVGDGRCGSWNTRREGRFGF